MMELQIREMTPQERHYCYSQSAQIEAQTGCIGHLRADMDSNGKGFFSSWTDHRGDLKTQAFKNEFDEVLNALRFDSDYGGILKDRNSLSRYCYSHPEASFGNDREWGFRADTPDYTYMLRLNPHKGEYNLYCYCVQRVWLEQHMKRAEKGIRFITPDYREKFHIMDGEQVRITGQDSTKRDCVCRYIDDYHLEVGSNLFHICELAERLEQTGSTVIPLRADLPEKCFVYVESTNEIGIVTKGEKGYIPLGQKPEGVSVREGAALLNETQGVTKAQAEAMKAGSLFGWDTPAADPKNYDDAGKPLRPKHRERGEAR